MSAITEPTRSVLDCGRSSLRSLKHKRLRLYFIGVGISLLGTFLQLTLLRWTAFTLTNSAVTLGLLSLCSLVPNAVLAIPAGLFVASRNKRNVLLVTQAAAAFPAAAFAYLTATGGLTETNLLVLSFALGCVMPFETASRFPLMAECVEGDHPANAFSLSALVFYLSRCVGPLLGGLVLGLFSISTGFAINFASYILEICMLLVMGKGVTPTDVRRPAFRELGRFCIEKRNAHVLAGVAVVGFLGVQLQLMPAVSVRMFAGHRLSFGLLIAANEMGAVGAALWLTTLADNFDQSRIFKPAIILMASALLVFCGSGFLILGLAAMFVVGLGQGLLITSSQNLLQSRAPVYLRAPLSSVFWAGFFCCQGIGASVLSTTAELWDIRTIFVLTALALLAVAFSNRQEGEMHT